MKLLIHSQTSAVALLATTVIILVFKHQNNARVSAETVRHESIYIILFLARDNKSINDDKNDDLYTSSR